MSRVVTEAQSEWLTREQVAKRAQAKYPHITENTIVHAAYRKQTLPKPKVVEGRAYWHVDWVDQWLASL